MSEYIFNSKRDIAEFIKDNLITSADAAVMLNCSRANVSDLVKREKLIPAVELSQTLLFWRSDVEERIASNPKAGRPLKKQ